MKITKRMLVGAVFASAMLSVGGASAQVRLSGVFSDNMVLQAGKPVKVWGWAATGAKVEVEFAGAKVSATAEGRLGEWKVTLPAMTVSKEGRELKVTERTAAGATTSVTLVNVLVGEVWILSGQSNMQWKVNGTDDYPLVLARANYPLLRYMQNNEGAIAMKPARQLPAAARWVVCDTNVVGSFSATGFYFGERLMLDRDVPVGLVMTACGGTSMPNWTPYEALDRDRSFAETRKQYEAETEDWIATNGFAGVSAALADKIDRFANDVHLAKTGKGKYPWPRPSPTIGWTGWPANRIPAAHWNAKIAPIVGLSCAGVLWYQGETESWAWNLDNPAARFGEMLGTMIRAWREKWGEELPFVVAQLPSMAPNSKGNLGWPVVRSRQRQLASELAAYGAAPTLDSGWEHDVHPHDKTIVGERLARVARRVVYGEKDVALPPVFRAAEFAADGAKVVFASEAGLVGRGAPRGFQLKFGGEWTEAVPRLEADGSVFVASPAGKGRPDAVRYLWKGWDKPDVWLYDRQGVPVSSFSWPFMVN